jgi:hypothetical protein
MGQFLTLFNDLSLFALLVANQKHGMADGRAHSKKSRLFSGDKNSGGVSIALKFERLSVVVKESELEVILNNLATLNRRGRICPVHLVTAK